MPPDTAKGEMLPDRSKCGGCETACAECLMATELADERTLTNRLRAEVEALRELYTEENNERAMAQAENKRLRADLGRRDDFLYEVRKVSAAYEDYLAGLALPADEEGRSDA